MYLRYSVFIILCFAFPPVFAQSTEADKLLEQAGDLISYNPSESESIAELALKNASDDHTKIKAHYISALSHYVKGEFDKSLSDLFIARNLSEETNNETYLLKTRGVINHILSYLKLNTKAGVSLPKSGIEHLIFGAENDWYKGTNALRMGRPDSASLYLQRIKETVDLSKGGYPAALNYWLLGDIDFKKKNFNASLNNYKKAKESAKELNNPVLSYNLNQRLAANYLAMDSLQQFQEVSDKAKAYSILTLDMENRASSEVHRQKIQDSDNHYKSATHPYLITLIVLSALMLILLSLKLIFYVRNHNKLNMYNRMLDYLKVQGENIEKQEPAFAEILQTVETEEEPVETTPENQPRQSSLLKESEEHLLEALEKFESSNKYTNKDMSLGKLASQLNTNTKYLSEVINRHKGKNFNAYINELRINYITNKIKNTPAYLNYKVSYLAEECGFSSHSTFTTVFKSIVGVSPIVFVDFVREGIQKEEISS